MKVAYFIIVLILRASTRFLSKPENKQISAPETNREVSGTLANKRSFQVRECEEDNVVLALNRFSFILTFL